MGSWYSRDKTATIVQPQQMVETMLLKFKQDMKQVQDKQKTDFNKQNDSLYTKVERLERTQNRLHNDISYIKRTLGKRKREEYEMSKPPKKGKIAEEKAAREEEGVRKMIRIKEEKLKVRGAN